MKMFWQKVCRSGWFSLHHGNRFEVQFINLKHGYVFKEN